MKTTARFSILALEPDRTRGENLRRLIKERVDADVMIATSAQTAIASLARHVPDLVLTSALVPPAEDEQLISHLRQLSEAHDVPVLTVPPVVDEREAPSTNRRRLGFLMRGIPSLFPSYDPDVVGERIAEALRESARKRTHDAGSRSSGPFVNGTWRDASAQLSDGSAAMVLTRGGLSLRDRDERWLPDDLPWLGGVQTPWGLKLQLLNISTSGLLVESTSRFLPDSFSELYLIGLGRSIAVPARLVRSEVADVTSLGVKYRTAAAFDRKLDLVLEHHGLPSTSLVTPRPLAALLKEVTDGPVSGGEAGKARARFEQGLRQLIPACDIRIRAKPLAAAGGGETVFLTVPTRRSSPPVLQVTFEPDYKPAERELKLLKAAASVAAAVLESEGSSPLVGPVNAW